MSIIQLLFTGSGVFTKTNFWATTAAKPRVTVMEDSLGSLFTIDTVRTRSILVEMWGGGGASGSTRYGTSGYGGSGGYISGRIPTSALSSNILRLVVGGGGGATGGGDLNPVGSNDYYARPIAPPTPGQFAEFNVSTIQHVASTSTSSNPTFSTITPVTGSTVSSSNSVTYSTVTPVAGSSVSSISSPTYNTVSHIASVSDANVNSLTITPGILQVGDIILVSSVCATGQIPQNNPNTPTGYTILENATVNGNVNYKLSYRRVTNTTTDATIANLSASINDDNGDPFVVAHTASIFRNVFGLGDPITSLNTNNTASTSIDPPQLNNIETPNYTTVAFGFLSGGSVDPVDINDPANYTRAVVQRVGTNVNAANEATTMVAYRSIPNSGSENPLAFTVPAASSDSYVAITVGLMPTKTLSTISGSMDIPAAAGLVANDIVLVSSVSDGGTMTLPSTLTGNFSNLSDSIGAAGVPAYRVSWKRLVAGDINLDGSVTISTLSTSGLIIGGQANGQPAGVAHYATAFRNASTTINPSFTESTGTPTGNPDSPSITTTLVNSTVLSFGFLNNRSLPTVTAPGGYTLLTNGVNTVGSDATGTTEATSMVAYSNPTTQLTVNPGAFTVTGSGTQANYAAVTVALEPIRTLSPLPGTMDIPAAAGLVANDIVLVSSVSDGGTMTLPSTPLGGSFIDISNSTGSPSYQVSWKRIVASDINADGSVTINGLSLSGTTGGLAAGVAHHATAFRGVDTTAATPFVFATATPGTGNPDPPAAAVSLPTSNYTAVAFGFLNNTALPTVSPPTGYNQLSTLTVSDSTPGAEATSMVAYRASLGSGTADVNPGAFSVTGVGGQNNAAVTVALRPSPVAIGGDFSTLTLPAVQPNDLIIVASVSDGGGLATPTGYTVVPGVPSQTGSNSPSYQISYKITNGTDTQVTGLSPSGTVDGDGGGSAGVAHVASVYRGVSLTTPPAGTPANGNGNPDPPQINGVSSGDGVVVFGFLDDISITDANITAPTTPIPGYTKTVTRAVGTDNNGDNEATVMSAFKLLTTGGNENPGAFSVNGNDGRTNSAISIRLVPQVNARFSTATGACGGSGGGYSGIFLSTGTPLLIAGGGGGGGGATAYPFVAAFGGNGGSGASFPGGNGNISVLDTAFLPSIVYRSLGTGGGGGTIFGGGTGGITLAGGTATPIIGNAGEAGQIYNSPSVPLVDGFYSGGRGANSPYNDLTSLPLQGANATGGWNRGAGGGSSRTDSFTTPVPAPTDCGGGGGGGYYGGGGGGSGDGGGGGGGGGGSNYADPLVSVLVSAGGDSLTPGIPAATLSPNYIPGVAVGGAPVVGAGVDVPGNPGGNGLIILTYFA